MQATGGLADGRNYIGNPALEFSNTDAEIYGIDLAWGYYLSDALTIEGTLSYVRGQRTDIEDDLYRLAPLNGVISVLYERGDWSTRIDAIAYASQDDVAAFNDEPATPGYGVLNAQVRWQSQTNVQLSVSVENLLDKSYQPHLGGINRVNAVDIPVGDRLYATGRSLNVGIGFSW